jgi:hypothetical protein
MWILTGHVWFMYTYASTFIYMLYPLLHRDVHLILQADILLLSDSELLVYLRYITPLPNSLIIPFRSSAAFVFLRFSCFFHSFSFFQFLFVCLFFVFLVFSRFFFSTFFACKCALVSECLSF